VGVNRVWFVDKVRAGSVQDGTLTFPFDTVQKGVNAFVAAAVAAGAVMVAPGTYTENLSIGPDASAGQLTIQGWDGAGQFVSLGMASISGNMVVNQTGTSPSIFVEFANISISGTITSNSPKTVDLLLTFKNVSCSADIEGANVILFVEQSRIGKVTGNTSFVLNTDGWSWSENLANDAAGLWLPTTYTRAFYDTGADTYSAGGNLTCTGLAAGSSVTVYLTNPLVRAGDFAIIATDPTGPHDFTATFEACRAGEILVRLRNDSRISTTFNEPCSVLVFHQGMTAVPTPPRPI
jgi:hypothetical protein